MNIIFTHDGYIADNGTLTIEQIYNSAFYNAIPDDPAHAYLVRVAQSFVNSVVHDADIEINRTAPQVNLQSMLELLHELPYCLGMEHVNISWLTKIWNQLADIFNSELEKFDGTLEEYIKSKNNYLNIASRVFFHLVETKEEEYPFAFMATYSTKSEHGAIHVPLKNALKEFREDYLDLTRLLATVYYAACESEFITDLIDTGELFESLKFRPEEAYIFLREVPLYEKLGIICRIPDFWKRKKRTRLSFKLDSQEPSVLGIQSLISLSPSVFLGDVEVTREELEELIRKENGLAFLKGKWIEVNQEKLSQLICELDKFNNKNISLVESLKILSGVETISENDEDLGIEITSGEWLSSMIEKLREPSKIKNIEPPNSFKATLRHYQQAGLNWLNFTRNLGFGALLADDMGLGKTIQILAFLDKLREEKIKTLLIVPTSLLVNWQKEAAKFTPSLKLYVIHGTHKKFDINTHDLFITTYGMVTRLEELAKTDWDLVILDEAQAIKNASTKSTRAIKNIPAKSRVAMTGTPIENRLGDLWSIFDFLNSGMLGTAKEFSLFTSKLKKNPDGYSKLRNVVSPFILRRLKTDKNIISDLPDKLEIIKYTSLTKKQVVQYNALVKELKDSLLRDDQMSKIQRSGKILAAIMKFKQICNHPDQFVGQGDFDSKYSGKFETLAEICETIRDKHESILVFTQFREMCEPLNKYLTKIFNREGLMIHGGTTPKKRGTIVEQFNSEYVPFMVLSLKAGGVGLNLTSANHVVHFDRWWNPAIENQATDRAFRIGQTKNVMVYKFVTSGTIEDKIHEIIINKQKLATDIIAASSGENWVTEMSNSELLNLFKLEV